MNTITSTTLLASIKDTRNHSAWQRFDSLYRPMIVGYALKRGVKPSDVDDVAQETLIAFQKGYQAGRFDHNKGSLRSWIFSIVEHKVCDLLRHKGRRKEFVFRDRTCGTGVVAGIEISGESWSLWDEEWKRQIRERCEIEMARQVAAQTMEVYQLVVKDRLATEEVARRLGMSPGAVYSAKHRALKMMRELFRKYDEGL